MKKTDSAVKTEVTRRVRRRSSSIPSDAASGPSAEPSVAAKANPESVPLWQQLNAVGNAVAPRYRRD
jgi:hypothetical protein